MNKDVIGQNRQSSSYAASQVEKAKKKLEIVSYYYSDITVVVINNTVYVNTATLSFSLAYYINSFVLFRWKKDVFVLSFDPLEWWSALALVRVRIS